MLCTNLTQFQKNGQFLPCGQCMSCRINRHIEWQTKLELEYLSHNKEAYFVTLTYSPENLPENGSLSKRHAQLWQKRVRDYYHRATGGFLRFFTVGEYGGETHRPHYHAIIFGGTGSVLETSIREAWELGYVQVGMVKPGGFRYISGYTLKKMTNEKNMPDELQGLEPEFSIKSTHPALGFSQLPVIARQVQKNNLTPALSIEERYYSQIDLGLDLNFFDGWFKMNGRTAKLDKVMMDKLVRIMDEPLISAIRNSMNKEILYPKRLKFRKEMLSAVSKCKTFNFFESEDYEKTKQKQAKIQRHTYKGRTL